MKRFAVIIAYDIRCNKRRRKIFHTLQAWSLDAQYSVFECYLSNKEAEELFLQLTHMIDEKEDRLMLAWVDKARGAHAVTNHARIGFKMASTYMG